MSSGRIGRIGAGLFDAEKRWPDAQRGMPDAEYVKKGAEIDDSQAGVSITRLGNGDWFYAVDTTAASRTVTLPSVSGELGHHHIVKRISGGSNACHIVAEEGTAILDGSATHSIAAQYGVRCYFSDGEAWCSTGAVTGSTGEVASGVYTPTLTNLANLDASTSQPCQWLRVGNTVTVSGSIFIDPTAAAGTLTQVAMSLPIASDFANEYEAAGYIGNFFYSNENGRIGADAANNRVNCYVAAGTTTNHDVWFTFTYRVI